MQTGLQLRPDLVLKDGRGRQVMWKLLIYCFFPFTSIFCLYIVNNDGPSRVGEGECIVSCGCSHTLQTWWLKTTHLFSHSTGGQKSEIKVTSHSYFFQRVWGESVPCPIQSLWLLAFLGLWLHHSYSASVVMPPLPRLCAIVSLSLYKNSCDCL